MAVYLALFVRYDQLIKVKNAYFYIVCGGFVAVMLALSLESVAIGMIKPKDLRKKLAPSSLTQWFLLGYLVLSFVSALLSRFPETWVGISRNEGFFTIALYVLSYYFVAKFIRPEKWMMYAFGGAVTVFGIISVIQLAGVPLLFVDGQGYYETLEIERFTYIGTVGNVDLAAALLAMVIPAMALYVVKAEEKYRFVLLIPLLLSVAVLLKIWVLLGLVGVAAAAVVAFPYGAGLKKRGVAAYFAVLPVLALVAVGVLYAVPFQSGFLFELHSILHGQISETFGTGRIHIWKEVLEQVPQNLLFGTGPDTMVLDFAIEPFRRLDAEQGWLVRRIDVAHNDFLNILYHQGIFALGAYLGAAVTFGISFFRNAPRSDGALICGSAVIGYGAALMFGMSVHVTSVFFWLCLGLFEGFAARNTKKTIA